MIKKPRAPRPVRRTGTEVHADSRTSRRRTRADEERAHLEEQLAEWETNGGAPAPEEDE